MVRHVVGELKNVSYWCGVDEPMPGRSMPMSPMFSRSAKTRASVGI